MNALQTFIFHIFIVLTLTVPASFATAQPASTDAETAPWLAEYKALNAASPDDRIDFLERVIRNPVYVNDLSTQVDARVKKAAENRNIGNFSEALLDLEAAEKIASKSADSRLQGSVAFVRGTVHAENGKIADAIDAFHAANKFAEAEGDKNGRATAVNALGVAYLFSGNQNRAIDYFEESLSIALELGNQAAAITAKGNIGNALGELGQLEESLRQHQEALELAKAIDEPNRIAYQKANICDRLNDLERLDEAEPICAKALKLANNLGHMRLISGVLMTQGELLLKLGQPGDSLMALERAQKIAGASTFTLDDALAKALAKTHEALGNYREAAQFWQVAFEAHAARVSADREALAEELAVRYEVAKRDKDIELLNVRNELQNLELKNRSRQLFAVGGALLSALLIMAALWRGYQSKRTLETELKSRNAKLQDALDTIQKLASTDSLTGLLNRRAFHDIARQSLEYKRRTDQPISLTLGDVDGFKQINDQHGHATGDEILIEIATRLKDTLRTSDVVVRWGGEEFLCFFPDTDEAQALDIANKLRSAISAHDVTTSQGSFRVSITFGVAGVEYDVQDAIRRADVALYEGKHQGGNSVVLATTSDDKN